MIKNPLVSVIILSYQNYESIFRCLDAICEQDYPCIEIIVSDDGSETFDSEAVRSYIEEKSKGNIKNVIVLESEKNQGTVKNLKKAMQHFTGAYYINMGADDRLASPYVIKEYIQIFRIHDYEPLYVCGQLTMTREQTHQSSFHCVTAADKEVLLSRDSELLFSKLSHKCLIPTVATCYSRKYVEIIDHPDTSYTYSEEWASFLKVARKGICPIYIDRVMALHPYGGIANGSFLYSGKVQERFVRDKLMIFKKEVVPYRNLIRPADWEIFKKRRARERLLLVFAKNVQVHEKKGFFSKAMMILRHPSCILAQVWERTIDTPSIAEDLRLKARKFFLAGAALFVLSLLVQMMEVLSGPFKSILSYISMGLAILFFVLGLSITFARFVYVVFKKMDAPRPLP